MNDKAEEFPVLRIVRGSEERVKKAVATEYPLTIILNNQELVTLLCSPADQASLAVGFLSSEGLLNSRDEIQKITVDDKSGVVRIETLEGEQSTAQVLPKNIISSAGGRESTDYSTADLTIQKVESRLTISSDEVLALVHKFQQSSNIYLATHGVHNAALCYRDNILLFSEDIGRHNALDKIFGRCLLEDIATRDRLVITSGRISSEMVHRVARRAIPIIVSVSAPTKLGVSIADSLGITMVGFVRESSMDIYTHDWRIKRRGKPDYRTGRHTSMR